MQFLTYSFIGLVTLGLIGFVVLYATQEHVRTDTNEAVKNVVSFTFVVAFVLSLSYYLGKFMFPAILNLLGVKFPL